MNSGESQPPDRWIACPPYGELISSNFLPMKTPLSKSFNIPHNFEFTPAMFVKQMRERKINLGLVINLTFSTRYYDEQEFTQDFNIEYKHIPCRGHNEAPQPKERQDFINICSRYISKNPNKVIAVHCTHGFNRTGFMISSYLCAEEDWSIGAAIATFTEKRGPGIYKQDYIAALFSIYGDSDDVVPKAPERPVWDSDDTINLDGDPSAQQEPDTMQFYEGITGVTLVRDTAMRNRIYHHCCMLCNYAVNSTHPAFPGAQPVSMDRQNVEYLRQKRYRVSWKADGCRYMLYIQDEDNIFFLTRSLQLWKVEGLRFPKIDNLNMHLTDTLLDGEMVTDIIEGSQVPKYLIYDVVSLNGEIVAKDDFDKRCGLIKCVIVRARRKAKEADMIGPEPFKVADKGFFYIHSTKKTWKLNVTHEKDGLIYQPVDVPYTGGTCHEILKWKPPELNSIDFKLLIRTERRDGCLPEQYVCLHASNKQDAMVKIKMTNANQHYRQYDGKIVEVVLKDGKWDVIRERTDKLYPNSYETATATFKSIRNPVTEEYLYEMIAKIPPESAPPR